MLPERYQGVPCASVRANSSKMRRCAAQPSHLSSSLHPAPPRKPKASPPVIAEWHQPLSAAACRLTRLLLHMKPALAAVRRVARSAFHVQRRNRTHPCQTLRFGRLLHARPSAAVYLSASCVKELVVEAHTPLSNAPSILSTVWTNRKGAHRSIQGLGLFWGGAAVAGYVPTVRGSN